jgi:hypothetical protein
MLAVRNGIEHGSYVLEFEEIGEERLKTIFTLELRFFFDQEQDLGEIE